MSSGATSEIRRCLLPARLSPGDLKLHPADAEEVEARLRENFFSRMPPGRIWAESSTTNFRAPPAYLQF